MAISIEYLIFLPVGGILVGWLLNHGWRIRHLGGKLANYTHSIYRTYRLENIVGTVKASNAAFLMGSTPTIQERLDNIEKYLKDPVTSHGKRRVFKNAVSLPSPKDCQVNTDIHY